MVSARSTRLPFPSPSRRPAPEPPSDDRLATGFAALDAALPGGGLPRGALVEITGAPSSGRTSLAFAILGRASRRGEEIAYVDPFGTFFAPSARASGILLERLLVVCPSPPTRAAGRRIAATTLAGLAAAESLLLSAGFALVLLDLTDTPAPPPLECAFRMARRARASDTLLLVLTRRASDRSSLGSAVALRLSVRRLGFLYAPDARRPCVLGGVRLEVAVSKSRHGPPGARVEIVLSPDPPLS